MAENPPTLYWSIDQWSQDYEQPAAVLAADDRLVASPDLVTLHRR
jgi:hypothetical protein